MTTREQVLLTVIDQMAAIISELGGELRKDGKVDEADAAQYAAQSSSEARQALVAEDAKVAP